MKTSELIGPALDWAVAKCEGYVPITHSRLANVMVEREDLRGIMSPEHIHSLRYSTDWSQGGPIIEREGIELKRSLIKPFVWAAFAYNSPRSHRCGPTPLIAAMRCYVASKLGNEVDVPKELL